MPIRRNRSADVADLRRFTLALLVLRIVLVLVIVIELAVALTLEVLTP